MFKSVLVLATIMLISGFTANEVYADTLVVSNSNSGFGHCKQTLSMDVLSMDTPEATVEHVKALIAQFQIEGDTLILVPSTEEGITEVTVRDCL
ncbi:hypothetical protein GT360_15935 [Vibrio astriarenae]|uniref:Uncharacterized protein n=1 Tax=Vibrio astriarenae TaxID=1481923 RepID=A0A7Z2T667_9VIBR|nr:hypothetical protein [Vibrio astriarenae]QIA65052.1 hypothetical protein GT360_15935 [Vibrio astriarenae]